MKVKYKAEDFFVEEILKEGIIRKREKEGKQPGKFAVYKLEKKGIDTFSALHEIAKILRVRREMISSCGLKDKYSISIQYVAVDERGFKVKPPRTLRGKNWSAELVGQSSTPLKPKYIYRNFFKIVLRDIHPDEVREYDEKIKRVSSLGFPNYFDEQRFGSARHFADDSKIEKGDKRKDNTIHDFIGKRVLKRDYEGALKIHFQAVSDFDRSNVKKFKKIMREKWGNWAECLLHAREKNDFAVLRYLLRKPKDFKGAFEMLEPRLARLYLEVYQNYIFNLVLSEVIKIRFDKFYIFPYVAGEFVFPHDPSPSEVALIRNLKIPLPHPSAVIPPEIKEIYTEILRRENVKLEEFRSGLKNADFVRSERPAWEIPEEVEWKIQEDEEHEGMQKIEISFYLKPGVFATMFIKNITPLVPISETEKKPIPKIITRDGREIKVEREKEKGRRKKLIIAHSS